MAVIAFWKRDRILGTHDRDPDASVQEPSARSAKDFTDALRTQTKQRGRVPDLRELHAHVSGQVTIAGRVVDTLAKSGVSGVEVVFRSDAGEETATSGADGAYSISVPAGTYKAFVRDDGVFSVGRGEPIRVPGAPIAGTAGAPDEGLMATIVARGDVSHADLPVLGGGVIAGRVLDPAGKPIAGAMVRAVGRMRPALGTDIAESGADGTYELRVPQGQYVIDASHDRFAGAEDREVIVVERKSHTDHDVTLVAGCVISGRVLAPDGKPAAEGAIEKQWGTGEHEYAPAARIESDGTFRWTSTEMGQMTIRAWPWKSAPSQSQVFSCSDGARFANVVFQIPARSPDLEGTLVDADGNPVPFTYVDIAPQAAGGVGQQERTDAEGHWAVYALPSGPYRVAASAEGRGFTNQIVQSPTTGIALKLGGVGRIEGVASRIPDGSFTLELGACEGLGDASPVFVAGGARLVTVTDGHFAIDDVPACKLTAIATAGERTITQDIDVQAGTVTKIELAVGPPLAKTLHGIVRDTDGSPVSGATITAEADGNLKETTTDAVGRYTIETVEDAQLVAMKGDEVGIGAPGSANVPDEEVDIQLSMAPPDENEPEVE
ncbi:MAG TPA: carboxypeptidase-like regulatory domain-containing protein [Kofleriaceae bacterium]